MVDRNIVSRLGFTPEELDSKVNELFTAADDKLLSEALEKKLDALTPGTILKGRIMQQIGSDVILEIGLKNARTERIVYRISQILVKNQRTESISSR